MAAETIRAPTSPLLGPLGFVSDYASLHVLDLLQADALSMRTEAALDISCSLACVNFSDRTSALLQCCRAHSKMFCVWGVTLTRLSWNEYVPGMCPWPLPTPWCLGGLLLSFCHTLTGSVCCFGRSCSLHACHNRKSSGGFLHNSGSQQLDFE